MEEAFFFEVVILLISIFLAGKFVYSWFIFSPRVFAPRRHFVSSFLFCVIPLLSVILIGLTLGFLAASDVINDGFYICYYIILGIAWLQLSLVVVSFMLGLSWRDDFVNNDNNAALISVFGVIIGITLIYSGANIGEGPGWWCVVFAGLLGTLSFLLLLFVVNISTRAINKVTVDRDIYTGIRMLGFTIGLGIILGRASGGDWTSFVKTLEEFLVAWPALPLTTFVILTELLFNLIDKKIGKVKLTQNQKDVFKLVPSILLALIYIGSGVTSLLLFPSIF